MKTFMSIYQFMQNTDVENGEEVMTHFYDQNEIYMLIFRGKADLGLYKDRKRLFEISFDINSSKVTLYDARYDDDGCLRINRNQDYVLSINSQIDDLINLNLYSIKYLQKLFEEMPDVIPEVVDANLNYSSVIVLDGNKQGFDFSYAIIAKDTGAVIVYLRNTDVAIISKDERIDGELFMLNSKQFDTISEAYQKWCYMIGKLSKKRDGKYFINRKFVEHMKNGSPYDIVRLVEFMEFAEKDIGHLIGNNNLC